MTPAKKNVLGATPACSPEPWLWGTVPPQPISIIEPSVELEARHDNANQKKDRELRPSLHAGRIQ